MGNESALEKYVGNVVTILFKSDSFTGKVNQPNYDGGYVDLQPSFVFSADGKILRIESEMPTRFSLSLFGGDNHYIIVPQSENYMEERAKFFNESSNRGPMGFKQD